MEKPVAKFYWTKSRRTQLKYWQVLGITFFLAVSIIGGSQVYTEKLITKLKIAEVAYAKSEPEIIPIEEQVRRLSKEANFEWTDYLIKLMKCENLRHKGDFLDPKRVNTKGNKPVGSRDRGLFMINSYHQHQISDEQAFDIEWSTKWTMGQINAGYQREWMCDVKIKSNKIDYLNW